MDSCEVLRSISALVLRSFLSCSWVEHACIIYYSQSKILFGLGEMVRGGTKDREPAMPPLGLSEIAIRFVRVGAWCAAFRTLSLVLNRSDWMRRAVHGAPGSKKRTSTAHPQAVNALIALGHSVCSSALILKCFADGTVSKLLEMGPVGMVSGKLPTGMVELTTGYFLHDMADMRSYGKLTTDMVIHHLSSIGGGIVTLLTDTCGAFWLLGASAEVNSVSLHIRSLLQLRSARDTLAFKLNTLLFLVSFACARIGIQGYGLMLSFQLLKAAKASMAHRLLGAFGTASGAGLCALNAQLLSAIVSSDVLGRRIVSKHHWTHNE